MFLKLRFSVEFLAFSSDSVHCVILYTLLCWPQGGLFSVVFWGGVKLISPNKIFPSKSVNEAGADRLAGQSPPKKYWRAAPKMIDSGLEKAKKFLGRKLKIPSPAGFLGFLSVFSFPTQSAP